MVGETMSDSFSLLPPEAFPSLSPSSSRTSRGDGASLRAIGSDEPLVPPQAFELPQLGLEEEDIELQEINLDGANDAPPSQFSWIVQPVEGFCGFVQRFDFSWVRRLDVGYYPPIAAIIFAVAAGGDIATLLERKQALVTVITCYVVLGFGCTIFAWAINAMYLLIIFAVSWTAYLPVIPPNNLTWWSLPLLCASLALSSLKLALKTLGYLSIPFVAVGGILGVVSIILSIGIHFQGFLLVKWGRLDELLDAPELGAPWNLQSQDEELPWTGSIRGYRPTRTNNNENIRHDFSGEDSDMALPQHTTDTQESELEPQNHVGKPTAAANPVSKHHWKPAYLQKATLIIFPALFLGFIVSIQVLVAVSRENDGLATSSRNLHYLWTFGPMIALTLIAAFWARVEFQLKSAAPWAHMVDGQSFDRALLLDYLAMLQPVAIVKAVKNKDWAVASASSCSLILRIAIILSTALIVLMPTEIHDTPVPVTILSKFVDNTTELEGIATELGSSPYYSMIGLIERNMSFPDGTSNIYAFQQFIPTEVPDAHLTITVEGFTSRLTCQPAALNTSYSDCRDPSGLCWALEAQQCQYPMGRVILEQKDDGSIPSYYGTVGLSGCNGSTRADDVILYMLFGRPNLGNRNSVSRPNGFSQSTQIVCKASYSIDAVDVVSNRTDIMRVTKSKSGSSRQIDKLSEGKMLELYFRSFGTDISGSLSVYSDVLGNAGEPEIAQLDPHFQNAIALAQANNPIVSSLLNDSFLEESLGHYYQQNAVFIAKSVFSERALANVTGRIDLKKERLIVNAATGHSITALLSVALILSLGIVLIKLELPILPKSPTSVIRTIQLLADSKEVLSLLSGAGPASSTTLENRLRNFHCRSTTKKSNYDLETTYESFNISVEPSEHIDELHYLDTPTNNMKASLVLNPIALTSVQIIIIGVVVALEVILQISGSHNDFVDVSDQQYIHLAWTVLPALVMSLISMYFGAVDSEIRSLTPFSKLSKGTSLSQIAKLDLLDGSTPRLLWREYRTECFAALATTLCLFTSSFFTIFVGSLYNVVTLPVNTAIKLQTDSSFNITNTHEPATDISKLGNTPDFSSITTTLILQNNLSYPSSTYESLAFPVFSMIDGPGDVNILPSDVVNVTVPALRSKMSCKRYSSAEIQMEIISARTPGIPASHQSDREVLAINLDGEPHRSLTIPNGLTHNIELPLDLAVGSDWVFGFGESCSNSGSVVWCSSDFLYVWGHKTNSTNQTGNHVAALTCNESVEAVDVSTTFFGPELRIDPSFPPRPINDSARTSTVQVHENSNFYSSNWLSPYQYLARGVNAPGSYLWPFFDLLTSSRYGVSFTDLDDPEKDESIARAIVFQHGIVRAQVLNEAFRGPANITNATLVNPPVDPEMGNDAKFYDGTVSSVAGRRRLAQDPASTRVLEGLLIAVLLLSSAGRLLMRNTKLLPRNATSIANVAALVADGNILSILPENAQLLSDEEIVAASNGRYLLRLGWWTSGEEDGSRQRFGIFAVKTSQESVFD
ncbi:hypothetical protein GQX73_g1262 [Xylaria multiplex]|uniref:Uncharacterized protein n=1 Tax=Xylaria multiplex TaxID=323545 RepID=A0A7C8IW08_9PEZI|nr:hypothetical protein GQX73_g1262 [Xylaria multiplex]